MKLKSEIPAKKVCLTRAVPLLLLVLAASATPFAQEESRAARVVVWQPRKGMERDFEEGYKRHLDWHRRAKDPWAWYGWTIVSGERFGWFVDATLFRRWSDFDAPVAPAEDSADNRVNVFPYGEVRSLATYELVAQSPDFSPQALTAPLLTFYYIRVLPGAGTVFEERAAAVLGSPRPARACVLLRPVDGADEYLFLVPLRKQSELLAGAELLRHLVEASSDPKSAQGIVQRVRSQTARYRAELSYHPKQEP